MADELTFCKVLHMSQPAPSIVLQDADREILEGWVREHQTPQRLALRARIILLASEGVSNSEIAVELGITRPTVLDWRRRFVDDGVNALIEIRPGRGRKAEISVEKVEAIVKATLHTRPQGVTHWSCRTMAQTQGVSATTVQRIWDAHGLQPHRVKAFKLSRDRRFVEKLTDVVGLYLNPPDKAVVLCVDEKSQIQALDRTQPGLPLKRGRCGTLTHDYKRHGTTLFAALIGECYQRHSHQEFLKFLRRLNREFPKAKTLHLVVDNYGTHKHPNVQKWLASHPRFHLHFTPTSSSWLNLVERWFREITEKRIRRGVFRSVPELKQAIAEFLEVHNRDPKPFVWTARVDDILAKVSKCKVILETLH